MDFKNPYLRSLPAVDLLLQESTLIKLAETVPRKILLKAAQEIIESYRRKIIDASSEKELKQLVIESSVLAEKAAIKAEKDYDSKFKYLINATGTIIHTNLGRAPLASHAVKAVTAVSGGYSNLELSLKTGRRGSRLDHIEELICSLTGAESAMVVNNNAAAVFLVLSTFASNGEVIVSRGQLVEIGGSFRIPDVMSASGATLIEVGTTNKCYLSDYEKAINEKTAMLLKVHTSNYRIVGFTAEVGRKELRELGKKEGIPVMEDLGSGTLLDLTPYGLPFEPRVQDCLDEGMQIVTFSGDKLLGGPQCGIIAGEKEMVARCRKNQLMRALRVDKYTIAALEATLRLYLNEEEAIERIPVLKMLTASEDSLKKKAQLLCRRMKKNIKEAEFKVVSENSTVGGGAFPAVELPTFAVQLKPHKISVDKLVHQLRDSNPPLIVRVQQDTVLLDLRTLLPDEEKVVVRLLAEALSNHI